MSNQEVLRRLGYTELVYDDVCSKGYLQVLYTIVVDSSSSTDLYSNLSSIESSISLWKSLHPFLRCRILNADTIDHVNKRVNFERYFVKVENEQSMSNVHYLDYVSHVDENDQTVWRLLNDLFLNSPILGDSEEYLWRLVFVRLGPNSRRYCIMFFYYHELGGGKTGHCLVKQLLTIIDAMIHERKIPDELLHAHKVPKSVETYLFNNNEQLIDDIRVPDEDIQLNNRLFIAHESLLESDGTKSKFKMNGTLYNHIGNTISKFHREIVECQVKAEKFMILTKEETRKLLEVCKRHGSKVTGCFGAIISLALHKAFKELEIEQSEIVYSVSINLNQFLSADLHPYQMGYYGARSVHKINDTELDKALDESKCVHMDQLFVLSATETDTLQSLIANGRIYEYPKLRKVALEELSKSRYCSENKNENTYKVHFKLSNIGAIDKFPGSIGDFKIIDFYMQSTLPKHAGLSSHMFIAYLVVVNDELHISFEVNTAVSSKFLQITIETTKEIIYKIIQEN